MSPPLLGVEEGGGHVTMDPTTQNAMDLKERIYLCLTDSSSLDNSSFNLKVTELRLGLPGLLSPERERDLSFTSGKLDEKQLFPLLASEEGICSSPHKTVFSGSKRGFSHVAEGNWMFSDINSKTELQPSEAPKFSTKSTVNVVIPPKVSQSKISRDAASKEKTVAENGVNANQIAASCKNSDGNPTATKALVVGWPPIRSFRKNSLATTSLHNDEVDGKPGPGALFVKVSMDGALYLRKVDLRNYSSYQELSTALEKMFSCFTLSQYGCRGGLERGSLSASKDSEYVLTYEDEDSDWMLVGDLPWKMFIDTCKKLKIMKSSDAIGLGSSPQGCGEVEEDKLAQGIASNM